MLHGYGSDHNDLFSFAKELPNTYHIIALKAPIEMQPYGNAWYSIYFNNNDKFSDTQQAIKARELVVNCIDTIIEKYDVNPNEISLLGFSQGTILSYAVGLSYPKKIKNIIGFSGYINEELLIDNYTENDFSSLSIYSSHGSVDQVIPVELARKIKPFMVNLDIDIEYSEFPIGHGVSPQNFYESKEWLLKHA